MPANMDSPTVETLAQIALGSWAAIQGFIAVYLPILLLVTTAILATPFMMGDTPWHDSAQVAGLLISLSNGVRPMIGGVRVSVIPLGVTILSIASLYLAAKRQLITGRPAMIAATASYAGLLTIVARMVGLTGWYLPLTACGAIGVAATALALLYLQVSRPQTRTLGRLPVEAVAGIKIALASLATLLGVSAMLLGCWAFLSRAEAHEMVALLAPGSIGAIALAVSQLAVLPNMVAWIAAWLIGPGFTLGVGSKFGPDAIAAGPLPQLPILTALPPGAWSGGAAVAVPVLTVTIAASFGQLAWHRLGEVHWRAALLLVSTGAATGGLSMAGLQWLAGGRLTAGRFAAIGASPWLVGVIFAGEIACGLGISTVTKLIWQRVHARKSQATMQILAA